MKAKAVIISAERDRPPYGSVRTTITIRAMLPRYVDLGSLPVEFEIELPEAPLEPVEKLKAWLEAHPNPGNWWKASWEEFAKLVADVGSR